MNYATSNKNKNKNILGTYNLCHYILWCLVVTWLKDTIVLL